MKTRLVAVLVILAGTAAALVLPAPAYAAPVPVTGLTVTDQAQGTHQDWLISVSWDPEATAVDGYRVAVVDQADGTNSPGSHYVSRDVGGTSVTLSTDALVAGHGYWVAVRSLAPGESAAATVAPFTAATLDTTGPTGSFTVNRTRAYLDATDFEEEQPLTAAFRIAQHALADDHTAAASIQRRVDPGDGRAPIAWTGAGTFKLVYDTAGSYAPTVQLMDGLNNVSTIALPTLTVLVDRSGPRVRITRPGPRVINRLAGWRFVRGTVTDAGSGTQFVLAMVAEKRGRWWWVYDFESEHWSRGKHRLYATLGQTDASPAFVEPHGNRWRTPRIRGLQRGLLHIETLGVDGSFNDRPGPTIHRRIH